MLDDSTEHAAIVASTRDAFFTCHASDADARHGLTMADLSGALMVWSTCNGNAPIETIAGIFRISEALARDAIESHPWLDIQNGMVVNIGY